MPEGKGAATFGDLYAKVNVILPKELSAREKEMLKELAGLRKQKN